MAGLTDAKIAALKAPDTGQVEYADDDVPGLRVRVGTGGAKTFILRKRIAGKPVNLTLGRYQLPRFGLKAARAKARAIITDIESGADPKPRVIEQRKTAGTAGTVRSLWLDYKETLAGKRSRTDIVRIFENKILPALGDRIADTVTRGDVTRFIDTLPAGGARHVHAQLSAFYSWAMPRLDRLETNPCRDAGRPAKAIARDRVLADEELRAVWQAADAEPYPWRAAIKLLVLTGCRRDEVFDADRAEIDIAAKLWTIPPSRTKNGVAHIIPLSDQALAVFDKIPEFVGAPKLFPSRTDPTKGPSGYSKLAARLTANVESIIGRPVERWVLHDLRRTLATGMQRLGMRLEVTEAVLNHVSGSRAGIVGVYQRHDYAEEKQAALAAWGREVERIVEGKGKTPKLALVGE